MNTTIKTPVLAAALIAFAALASSNDARGQEAALVHATQVTATQSLNDIDTRATPRSLARAYSQELYAELKVRLPREQDELADMLKIRQDFNNSLMLELDARLKKEIRNLTAQLAE